MSMDPEVLYLRLHDEIRAREYLQTRVDVLEHFIKMQFPEHFAGEVGTVADSDLNDIVIDLKSKPQEVFNDDTQKWGRVNS